MNSNLKKILLLVAVIIFVSPVIVAMSQGSLGKVGEEILTAFLTLFFGVIFFAPFVLVWRIVKHQFKKRILKR